MRVLGIETSCDETGVALYQTDRGLIAHSLHSQIDSHAPFGGVVPEIASRDHLKKTTLLVKEVMKKSGLNFQDIEGVAYTRGPGLVGALMIGAVIARSLAFTLNVPCVGVHHLEGHLLAAFLEPNPPAFPFLALLVSGGHTELVVVEALGHYTVIGATLDDAAGEAFDKTAKLLGLTYPGGAALAALAANCEHSRFYFPRPMTDRPGLQFSFSGLKTFAAQTVAAYQLTPSIKAEIAAAFQNAVVDTLAIKCSRALKATKLKRLVIAGGVGANQALRQKLDAIAQALKVSLYFPRPEFCTDNGAMIAYAGHQRLIKGQSDDLSIEVKPRWLLSDLGAP